MRSGVQHFALPVVPQFLAILASLVVHAPNAGLGFRISGLIRHSDFVIRIFRSWRLRLLPAAIDKARGSSIMVNDGQEWYENV